jgi:hypothetical protein
MHDQRNSSVERAAVVLARQTACLIALGDEGLWNDGSGTSKFRKADGTDVVPGSVVLSGDVAGPAAATVIQPSAVTTSKIAAGAVTATQLGAGASASNVGVLGGVLSGTLPNPTMAAGAVATNVGALPAIFLVRSPTPRSLKLTASLRSP